MFRLYNGKSRRKSSENNNDTGEGGGDQEGGGDGVQGGGEIRLVHANRDICSIVQSSIGMLLLNYNIIIDNYLFL